LNSGSDANRNLSAFDELNIQQFCSCKRGNLAGRDTASYGASRRGSEVTNAGEHASEADAKLLVAERIEERVERRVDVADPRDGRHELVVDALVTDGDHHEADEVGQETDAERAHDDAQLLGGLDVARQAALPRTARLAVLSEAPYQSGRQSAAAVRGALVARGPTVVVVPAVGPHLDLIQIVVVVVVDVVGVGLASSDEQEPHALATPVDRRGRRLALAVVRDFIHLVGVTSSCPGVEVDATAVRRSVDGRRLWGRRLVAKRSESGPGTVVSTPAAAADRLRIRLFTLVDQFPRRRGVSAVGRSCSTAAGYDDRVLPDFELRSTANGDEDATVEDGHYSERDVVVDQRRADLECRVVRVFRVTNACVS